MLQSIIATMVLLGIGIWFKAYYFIVDNGLLIFDKCCSICHSALEMVTNIMLDKQNTKKCNQFGKFLGHGGSPPIWINFDSLIRPDQ